ncbi:hypothetical protein ABIF66_001313 [Bradyrhizobium japonicum]
MLSTEQGSISLHRRDLIASALGAGLGAALSPATSEAAGPLLRGLGELKGDAEEELAYVLALECYVYGFPLVMMDATRAVMTATSKSEQYKAPINQFGRMRTYVDPDFKDCVRNGMVLRPTASSRRSVRQPATPRCWSRSRAIAPRSLLRSTSCRINCS